ncbi:MAG: radical SAM protein, partial [Leptospiraceae bacterium]|nr:radical SAM protein [Leptospiraceae bacterium]
NYSWNLDIAYHFAKRIKEKSPSTVIIFGGPNYGLTQQEIKNFWEMYPIIDFYIVKEGEIAFYELFTKLKENDFDTKSVKESSPIPGNCHFTLNGQIFYGEIIPRIQKLDEIPSPYLLGLMDKFFDNVLIPMIHTTRGCPFTCTFCTEGNPYYSKVSKRVDLKDELEYIATRRGLISDIVITDANFGMFSEDKPKALILADLQKRFNWPKRIIVSTGKNQKEKIVEVASILNGAMNIAASLQSTNQEILSNIKRSNISIDSLRLIVEQSNKVDSVTYTEIILGLPGDSYERHLQSLRDVTDAGLGIVRMYQLILLPQTELNTPETREKFKMKTKFRINPRSFGKYKVLGKEYVVVEHEEIVIENSTLSHKDYLQCRELDLTVEIIHNAAMFIELIGLCKWLNASWFDFVLRFHEKRKQSSESLKKLYDEFVNDNVKGLFDTKEQLIEYVKSHIDEYLLDTEGTNEIAKAKAKGFFFLMDDLHNVLFSEMKELIKENGISNPILKLYLDELCRFSIIRKRDFIKTDLILKEIFHFNFFEIQKSNFSVNPQDYYHNEPVEYTFYHNNEQKSSIIGYAGQYGSNSVDSLGRILMRASAKRLFRNFKTDYSSYINSSKQDMGLNVYGGFSVQ